MSCHVMPCHIMSYHVVSCHSVAWYSIGYVIVYVALCDVILVKFHLVMALDTEEQSTIKHDSERAYGCMLTYLRDT